MEKSGQGGPPIKPIILFDFRESLTNSFNRCAGVPAINLLTSAASPS